MSSILKALQRVEQERPAGAPSAPRRALRGDFVAQKGKQLLRRPRRRGPNAWVWGSLGAIVLLAALVWWRLPEQTPAVVAAAPEASPSEPDASPGEAGAEPQRAAPPRRRVARAEPAVAPPPAAEPAPPPAAEAPPAVAAEAAPAVAAELAPAVAAQRAEPAPPQADVPVEVAERLPPLGTTLDVPESAPVQQAPVPEAPAPAPQPAAVAEAKPQPAPEPVRPAPAPPVQRAARPERAAAPASSAPVIAKPAPKPAPPSAPEVLVERTRWHPSAERRAAWVSVEGSTTRELHEGDALGALVVKEIRPSSVVFLHGADTLQRRVGERQ